MRHINLNDFRVSRTFYALNMEQSDTKGMFFFPYLSNRDVLRGMNIFWPRDAAKKIFSTNGQAFKAL